MRRRSLLRAGTALPLAALAGCTGSQNATPSPTAEPASSGDTDTPIPTDAPTPTDATGTQPATSGAAGSPTPAGFGLDLPEANVTGVSVSRSGEIVEFDGTLHHDDGEEGYANWRQVERLDGTRLGRRELLHAHGTREFSRSATIGVPEDVACLAVRGHDQTHEYGGRAALMNLDTGETRFVDQGPEPRSFSESGCP